LRSTTSLKSLEARARAAAEEAKAGVEEGHYNDRDGRFARVWINFYSNAHWMICECTRPRGEAIEGTARRLDEETKTGPEVRGAEVMKAARLAVTCCRFPKVQKVCFST
jgi:hypothetical protein